MEDFLTYFRQAEKLLTENQFENDEDYCLFLENVFNEVDGKEARLACSHDGSQILEKLLGHANELHLRIFVSKLRGSVEKLSTHRYASHVLETLFRIMPKHMNFKLNIDHIDKSSDTTDYPPQLCQEIQSIAIEFAESDFISMISNKYASHVIRAFMILLEQNSRSNSVATLFFKKTFLTFSTKELRKICLDPCGSPVIQQAFKSKEFCSNIAMSLLGNLADNEEFNHDCINFIELAIGDRFGSHCIETFLEVLDSATFLRLYRTIIRPKLEHHISNVPNYFFVQHLISGCHNSTQFEMLIKDISCHSSMIVSSKKAGILLKILQWSLDHQASQDISIKFIFESFQLKTPNERKLLVPLALMMKAGASYTLNHQEIAHFDSIGCSILSLLPRFPSELIKYVIDSFISLSPNVLLSLARNPSGSRVFEAFLSGNLSLIAKERIVRKIFGCFVDIAADKYGSHVVDKCWFWSPLKLKNIIMKELLEGKRKLQDSPYGRIVLRNCKIEEFERKEEEWITSQAHIERKRALFADILTTDSKIEEPSALSQKRINTNNKKSNKGKSKRTDSFEKDIDCLLLP